MMRPRPRIVIPSKKKKDSKPKQKSINRGGLSSVNLLQESRSRVQSLPALRKRASIDSNLPVLNNEERDFFQLVKSGEHGNVYEFLQSRRNFNINCQNYEGSTALVFAVKAEDFSMVRCLLYFENLILGDAILHAVSTGNRSLVELLLDSRLDASGTPQVLEDSKGYSADFTSDITPLILAAHLEHYDIIRLLVKYGHRIQKLHEPNCFCKEKCSNREKGESLHESLARINNYKAIASPAYICQTSADPILTVFRLGQELREVSEIEREFKDIYIELAEQCSKFAVDILNQCRTTDEVEMVLHRKEGNERSKTHPKWRFTRVGLAIELEEKQFVAHNASQQVMRTAWLEGWQDWKTLHFVTKMSRLFPRIFLLPVIAIIYLLIPKSSLVKTWRAPLNKFLFFASSYIVFLALILAQNHLDSYKPERGPPNTGIEAFISLYVIGLTWRLLKTVWTYGVAWYIRQKWNLYDILQVLCFDAALVCWVWSYFDVQSKGNRQLPRRLWDQYDPTIIAELFYSIAITLAFGKLFYFFQIGQAMGPLLTSLSRMFLDIVHFMALFFVVMCSFSVGLFQIYHHYTGNVRMTDGVEYRQIPAFDTVPRAFITLYWSIYGYSPPNYIEVVVPDSETKIGDETIIISNRHGLTEAVGHAIFIVYYVGVVIILINLLIAMMSTSYSNVEGNRDVEWKFSRTKVWMIFFQPGQTLPPPFNIMPSPKSVCKILQWCLCKCRRGGGAGCSLTRCCYVQDTDESEDHRCYELMMTQLVQRYLTSRRGEKSSKDTEKENFGEQIKELRQMTHELKEAVPLGRKPGATMYQSVTPPFNDSLVDDVFMTPTQQQSMRR